MKRILLPLAICAALGGCYAYAPYGPYAGSAYMQSPYAYSSPYAYAYPYPYASPYAYYGGYGYAPFSISGSFFFGGGHGRGGWRH